MPCQDLWVDKRPQESASVLGVPSAGPHFTGALSFLLLVGRISVDNAVSEEAELLLYIPFTFPGTPKPCWRKSLWRSTTQPPVQGWTSTSTRSYCGDALTIKSFTVSLSHIYSLSDIPLCCALVVLFPYMSTWCHCYSMFLLGGKAAGVKACSRAEKKCPRQAKQKEVWENKIGLSQDPWRQLLQSFPTARLFLHAMKT